MLLGAGKEAEAPNEGNFFPSSAAFGGYLSEEQRLPTMHPTAHAQVGADLLRVRRRTLFPPPFGLRSG